MDGNSILLYMDLKLLLDVALAILVVTVVDTSVVLGRTLV